MSMNDISLNNVVGIDVGGTKIKIGVVTPNGKIINSNTYSMVTNTQDESVCCILDALNNFFNNYETSNIKAVGIGLVGHVNHNNGIWLNAINIPITKPIDLAEIVTNKTGLPTYLDNDVNAATLAEKNWGIGKVSSEFLFINVGTGIAMGIVSDNKMIRGITNYAGEIGHTFVGKQLDKWFDYGYLEMSSSGKGIVNRALKGINYYPNSKLEMLHKQGNLNPDTIFQAAESYDLLARIVVNQAIEGLCIGVANVINIFNPEHVIFGGGVFNNSKIIDSIKDHVKEHTLPVAYNSVKSLGITELDTNDIGLLGSASIAIHQTIKT